MRLSLPILTASVIVHSPAPCNPRGETGRPGPISRSRHRASLVSERQPLRDVARLFLKLGAVAFGGPAAHIAMVDDEVVERRRWMTRDHFLDLVGATNLIPGPNSTEMTMHVGFERAGWRGLCVAGGAFIAPAVLITGGLAWFYVRYGALPMVEPFLAGIKPAVIGIIASALWRLGRQAIRTWRLAALGVTVTVAVLAGANEVLALIAAGMLGTPWLRGPGGRRETRRGGLMLPLPGGAGVAGAAGGAALAGSTTGGGATLWALGLFFLKAGAVLYGSGYVLVAFLEGGLVEDYGWLTQGQLLDAIAIGQFTPGPVLSTATFVGYVVAGAPGAAVATAGIFLPSFLFVLVLNPLVPRLRQSPWSAAFLDAVNAAAVALMLAVTIELGLATLASPFAALIAAASIFLAVRYRVNAAWIVLGAAPLGWVLSLVGG